jgi:quinol-cytochrome oxidoreductase complex cytochrome b subunit/cytochrome c2
MGRLGAWLDEQTGWRQALAVWRDAPVAGGPRWGHAYGVALTALLGLEALTGVGLAAYYAPSTSDAWASVRYVQTNVACGWALRGLHHFGGHGIVIVLALHFLQTLWSASYRAPRVLNWLVGLALMNVLLALAHTGFLLPGDQRAYFATQIMLGITASIPVIGDTAQTLIQGGPEYGNLTLTHLYAGHVLVLPALVAALLGYHVALVRRQGRTPSPALSESEAAGRTEPYAAGQVFRDAALAAVAVGLVLAVVLWRHGAPFDGPADPSQQYPGRPEWYFYPLYELRKAMEGRLEWVATVILPGMGMTVLALLPWLDGKLRAKGRDGRRMLAAAVSLGFVVFVALGVVPAAHDWGDANFQGMRAQADKDAAEAMRLARGGVPAQGPAFLYRNDAYVWGRRLFAQQCASCHPACDARPYKGDPCLDGYASRKWLTALLQEPSHPLFFGNTKIDEMDPFGGSTDRLTAIVEFVYSQADHGDTDKPLAAKGRQLYGKEGCDSCHNLDGEGSGIAPDLKGYAGAEWLAAFIRAPGADRFYGKANEMDAFDAAKLDQTEVRALAAYLRAESLKTPQVLSSIP